MFTTLVIGSLAVCIGAYVRAQMKNAGDKLNVFLESQELGRNVSNKAMSEQLLALNKSTGVGLSPTVTIPEHVGSISNSTMSEKATRTSNSTLIRG